MTNHFTDKKFWSLEAAPGLARQQPGLSQKPEHMSLLHHGIFLSFSRQLPVSVIIPKRQYWILLTTQLYSVSSGKPVASITLW